MTKITIVGTIYRLVFNLIMLTYNHDDIQKKIKKNNIDCIN